jgi:hypothetical protein
LRPANVFLLNVLFPPIPLPMELPTQWANISTIIYRAWSRCQALNWGLKIQWRANTYRSLPLGILNSFCSAFLDQSKSVCHFRQPYSSPSLSTAVHRGGVCRVKETHPFSGTCSSYLGPWSYGPNSHEPVPKACRVLFFRCINFFPREEEWGKGPSLRGW